MTQRIVLYVPSGSVNPRTLEPDARERRVPASRVVRDRKRCVDCGACVGACLSGALVADPATRETLVRPHACVGCGLCVPTCGYGALLTVVTGPRAEGVS